MADSTSHRSGGPARVLTVGTYDGVHLGHQRIIESTTSLARTLGVRSCAVTFDRNPLEVIRPGEAPLCLSDLEQKKELLARYGLDEVIVLCFDEARAHQRAEDFVNDELVSSLHASAVVVGTNFRFGYRHAGDIALLTRLGAKLGFETRGVELFVDDQTGTVVSSSRIRELIDRANLEEAARCIGRPYELRGELSARGDAFRLSLGAHRALPPDGRYRAGLVRDADGPVPMVVEVDRTRASLRLPSSPLLASVPVGARLAVLLHGREA